MVRYLEYYHGLPGYKAHAGVLIDISLQKLDFRCGSDTYATAIEPAMISYREARERVVQMDKECLNGLGRSDITVKKFLPPHGLYLVLFAIVTVTFVGFSRRSNFDTGGILTRILPAAFNNFCWTVQPFVLYSMLIIHGVEAYHMATGRLRKHSVNINSKIWWQWAGATFIEGVGSFNRRVR